MNIAVLECSTYRAPWTLRVPLVETWCRGGEGYCGDGQEEDGVECEFHGCLVARDGEW